MTLKCKASLSAHDILIVHTHVDPETVSSLVGYTLYTPDVCPVLCVLRWF